MKDEIIQNNENDAKKLNDENEFLRNNQI